MIEHLTLRRVAKLFEQVDTETGAMALLEQIHALFEIYGCVGARVVA